MSFEEKCEIANTYVEYSNNHDVKGLEAMLEKQAIYDSDHVGNFHGVTAIIEMMTSYFELFPDARWQVKKYALGLDGRVEFTYLLTATNKETGEKINRKGEERITMSPGGLISYIEVLSS